MNSKNITIKDLQSLADVEAWVREATGKFTNQDISKENMLIILDYLKGCVEKSDLSDKSGWNQILNELIQRAEAIHE